MNKLLINKKNKLILIGILILAFFLRFSGAKPGFPPYHPDEGISYSAATSMMLNENLDPLRYDYPAVVPLINYISFKFLFAPINWANFYITHFTQFVDGVIKLPLTQTDRIRIFHNEIIGEREIYALWWGRYTTAFISFLTVIVIYFIGNKIFGKYTGHFASLILAVNYRHVLNSHIGLPDIYNAFFLALSVLTSFYLLNAERKNRRLLYFISGIVAGLSFSTKYQIVGFVPMFIAHIGLSLKENSFKNKLYQFFHPDAFILAITVLLVTLVINPYHLIHIEETNAWLTSVAGKYRIGKNSFDYFPYSYLYHVGLGKITSILIVLGTLFALKNNFRQSLLPFTATAVFLYVITYATGGGFYTRNLVSVIPLLTLFGGNFLARLFERRKNLLLTFVFLVLLSLSLSENFKRSYVLANEYRKSWNYKLMESWADKNIPEGSKIAAHSSVFLPERIDKVSYDVREVYSLQEAIDNGIDYVVLNLDWVTNGFYWWMASDTKKSLEYWEKPIDAMSKQYEGMMISEAKDYAIHYITKPAYVPDSNYIIVKVPKFTVKKSELVKEYTFDEPVLINKQSKNPWLSEPILVEDWNGFEISLDVLSETEKMDSKNIFAFVEFYDSIDDAMQRKNRKGVRLSGRNNLTNVWSNLDFVSNVDNAKYMIVGVYSYTYPSTDYFNHLKIYKADILIDMGNWQIDNTRLDDSLIYPDSHGNL